MDVDAYLAALADRPATRCRVKGWIVRASLRGLRLAQALPESVASQVDPLPVATGWVDLPAYHAALLYVAAKRSPTEKQFVRWYRRIATGAACMPNAGPIFQLNTGYHFLERLPAAWSQMFAGTVFSVDFVEAFRARVVLAYPSGMFPAILANGYSAWLFAGLECSGASNVDVKLVDFADRHATYEAQWEQLHGIWSGHPTG